MSTKELMARPSLQDDYVCRRAAEIIMPEIRVWSREALSKADEREWMDDLASVAAIDSGYAIARELETRHGWQRIDDELIEILGGGWVIDAIDELTRQWVIYLSIRPEFSVGDRVSHMHSQGYRGPGVVVEVRKDVARYAIRFPDMEPNSSYILPFEECEAVSA